LGAEKVAQAPGAAAQFEFNGTELVLVTRRGPQAGSVNVSVDRGSGQTFDLRADSDGPALQLTVARNLSPGRHLVRITSLAGDNAIDGFIVREAPNLTTPFFLAVAAAIGLTYVVIRRRLP
jgi:hypothetical protein